MKKRNPIISFVLSIILPGLGQVYNGEFIKAILFLLLVYPIYMILGLTGMLSSFAGFIALTLVILSYKLIAGIEAYRTSKRLEPYTLKKVNKVWIYIMFGLIGHGINWYGTLFTRYVVGHEFMEIPTPSMLPSIYPEDRILAMSIKAGNIKLGDIITFKREDGQSYLSRVVGLGNETISVEEDKVIFENGEEQFTKLDKFKSDQFEYQKYKVELPDKTEYTICKINSYQGIAFPKRKTSNVESLVVPDSHVYVVSDNRNNGLDSRSYGAIPIENIDKVVRYIWWSDDLSRVGLNLRQ